MKKAMTSVRIRCAGIASCAIKHRKAIVPRKPSRYMMCIGKWRGIFCDICGVAFGVESIVPWISCFVSSASKVAFNTGPTLAAGLDAINPGGKTSGNVLFELEETDGGETASVLARRAGDPLRTASGAAAKLASKSPVK